MIFLPSTTLRWLFVPAVVGLMLGLSDAASAQGGSWTPLPTSGSPSPRCFHTAVWTGTEMIIWGGRSNSTYYNTGVRYNPASNTWTAIATSGAPTARANHTAVWNGAEMLIWGGRDATTYYNTGARYNPVANTWSAISTLQIGISARADHTAVWIGTEMVIWGGHDSSSYFNNGDRYYLTGGYWQGFPTINAPNARANHTAILPDNLNTRVIIWGGRDGSTYFNNGAYWQNGSFNGTWTSMFNFGAPSARANHTAVYNSSIGYEMIVWGGNDSGSVFGDGGRYNLYPPGSWAGISTAGAPTARSGHTAVWTGYEMIVWGGTNVSSYLGDGGRYDPATDAWNAIATNNAPSPRVKHTAIWAGQNQMIVWGGTQNGSFDGLGDGARYSGEPPQLTNSPEFVLSPSLDCPASSAAPVGGAASFSLTATGMLPLSYQWRRDGANIQNATNASLVLSNLQPANAGEYTLLVTNWSGSVTSSAMVLNVNTQLVISPATLPNGSVGVAYRQTNTTCGGFAPYTFAVVSGGLPPGLSLSTSGLLSGTPTNVGTFNFTVQATGSNLITGRTNYTITIQCPVISINPSALPDGVSGSRYEQGFTASGGTAPYTFAITSGTLPPGLILNHSGTWYNNVPTVSNYTSYSFTVRATDRYGCSATRDYSISICPAIAVSPPTMPPGANGVAYAQNLTASGGVPPYQFSISSGNLPAGVTLTTNGFLSSTSAPCGRFLFTVKATDAISCAGYRSYTLVFRSPNCPQWFETTSLPLGGYAEHSLAYASGFLYLIGGFNSYYGESSNVLYSSVQSNGTLGAWNETTPLPTKILDHAEVAAKGFVYVLGGAHYSDENGYLFTNAVYYSKINSNGSLGTWQTAIPLPQPAYMFSATVWNNRIYVIGGWNNDAQSLLNTVYSAVIQPDGSLSTWVTQRPLPDAIYAHAGIANGMIYVLGGVVNGGLTIQNKVYYAKINDDGTLDNWNQTTPLPSPLAQFGAVAANGRVFVMGGSDASSPTSGFYTATVAGDGSLGSWSIGPALYRELYLHAVVVTESYIFLSGGQSLVQTESAVYSMPLPALPMPPAIVSQSFTNGNFQLGLAAQTNTGFGLLASTNLTNWDRIGWGFTGTNGLLSFQDTNAASFPRRYYRAFWPLP